MRKSMFLIFAAIFAGSAHAQSIELVRLPSPQQPATPFVFGTQDYEYTIIPATDFKPFDSATTYSTGFSPNNGNVSRTTSAGTAFFFHWFDIPRGAVLIDVTAYVR